MAEFNASAFSAVESFFVIDKQGASNVAATTIESANKIRHGNVRRLGVGAAAKPIKPSVAPTNLMKIGNKKRNHGDDDAEMIPDIYDEDNEEDVGRTGIVSDLPEHNDPADVISSSTRKRKKAKKKSGKKERQQLMRDKELAIQTSSSEVEPVTPSGTQNASVGDTVTRDNQHVQDSTGNKKESVKSKGSLSQEKQTRKRRKVRSRQKNIYKDNRPPDQKPDHLVPGGYEYKGRPITAETRAKLNKKQGITDGNKSSTMESMSSNWVDDNDEQVQGDNGVPIFNVKEANSVAVSVVKGNDSHSNGAIKRGASTMKKQKKPKYKNIQ